VNELDLRLFESPGHGTIDLDQVVRVGQVGGDPAWLSYSVFLLGNDRSVVFYEKRPVDKCHLPRERFLAIWKRYLAYKEQKSRETKVMPRLFNLPDGSTIDLNQIVAVSAVEDNEYGCRTYNIFFNNDKHISLLDCPYEDMPDSEKKQILPRFDFIATWSGVKFDT